jgi:protein phosphatase 1L
LWAVFDGHVSYEVAAMAARMLPNLVFNHDSWPKDPTTALSSALRQCNDWARREELKGGSTAVVVATAGSQVFCCSAGDSHAVFGLRGGGVRRMSSDHSTRNEAEVARIQAAGGRVEWGNLGNLPMTRGLGNFQLEADGFTCLPEVRAMNRSEVEFVVVASDGIWDHMTDAEVCNMVRDIGDDKDNAAQAIKDVACDRQTKNSREDDIAVVVAFLPVVPVGLHLDMQGLGGLGVRATAIADGIGEAREGGA